LFYGRHKKGYEMFVEVIPEDVDVAGGGDKEGLPSNPP
jgi:hypothetical protein